MNKLYPGVSSVIKFTLTDSLGAAVNDAVVHGTLYSPFDIVVLNNVTFSYLAASAGIYLYTVDGNTFNPAPERNCYLIVTATSGSNHYTTRADFEIEKLHS